MNQTLIKQTESFLSNDNYIAILANLSSLFYHQTANTSWAGFYLIQDQGLILGPFQGKVACTTIPLGKGVCGTVLAKRQSQLIPDVHKFPGHIACDSASNSELVVPLIFQNKCYGVIDLDSDNLANFNQEDLETFEVCAELIAERLSQFKDINYL